MSRLRLRGFLLLLIAALLLTYLIIHQPPFTPEQLKAQPMAIEGRKPFYVPLVFLIAASSTILGLSLVLFDLQNWLKKRKIERQSAEPDRHTL